MSIDTPAVVSVVALLFATKENATLGINPLSREKAKHGQVAWYKDGPDIKPAYHYGKDEFDMWLSADDFKTFKLHRASLWLKSNAGQAILRRRNRDWRYLELHGGCYALS
jgi:hypothetical protein